MNGGAILVDRAFLPEADLADLQERAREQASACAAVEGPFGRVTRAWSQAPLDPEHPVCRQISQRLDTKLDWSVLYYLDPGADIHPHRDLTGASLNKRIRFHVPIITNDGVDFRVGGERIVMRPGELWLLDTSYVHSVANRGAAVRVHLIVECPISPEIAAMLPTGWRRYAHDAAYVGALAADFAKAVAKAAADPQRFAAQMRMVARFFRWRVLGRGQAG